MSAVHGRSEAALSPLGGPARSAGGHTMSAVHGRSEAALSPLGGPARSAGGHTMSAVHGRSETALSPLGGPARSAGGHTMSAVHGRSEAALRGGWGRRPQAVRRARRCAQAHRLVPARPLGGPARSAGGTTT
jgi:hypothetical protein